MHIQSSPRSRGRRFVALCAATALALVGLMAAPANADAPMVSISPTTAEPGVIASFTVTVAGTATSSAAQTVSITVPAGFSSPSLAPGWTKPGASWTVAGPTGSTWRFSGSSSDKLNNGEQLVATFSAVTPSTAGPYLWEVSGTTNGSTAIAGFSSPTVTIGVVKQDQTITFAPIDAQTYGTGPLALTATASSGLPVSYTASGQCSVAGSSLTLLAAGSCSVTASQAGNASYFAAPDVTRTFAIGKAPQAIDFAPIDTQTYGTGPLTLGATGGGSGNPVTFTATGDCTVTDTSLSLDAAGSCSVTAHQSGNDDYLDAPDLTRTFSIAKAQAVLSLSGLSHTYDGQPHGATVTTDPAGLSGVGVTYDGSTTEPTDADSYDVEATLDNPNYEADSAVGTLVIAPKHVTGSFTVADKVYDGTPTATVTGCSVAGIEAGDTVTLDCPATTTFDGAGAGPHTATLSGATLSGPDAGNYELDGVGAATGTITPKTVTATLQAGDKVYDGNDNASATATLDGLVAGDETLVDVVVDSAHFDDENVGTAKTVTATVHLTGPASGNYQLASTTIAAQASINALHITGTFTAASKVYDGTTAATVLTRSLVGEVAGDDVALSEGTATFADETAGPGKTVTLTGAGLSGSDAGNYVLDSVATTTADITPKELTGSFTAADKVWDGSTDATITGRSLSGVISDDDVQLVGGTAHFDTPAVADGKTVTANGFTLDGTDKDNYTLAPGPWTTTASIEPLYSGKGFYQPVDMTPAGGARVYNSIKGGQTVPLKFEIFNAQTGVEQTSLSVFGSDPATAFKVNKIACTATSTPDDVIELVTTGGTALRYDSTGGQYIQNWKTPTGAGICYAVSVSTEDGTTIGPAYFKIAK